MRLHFALLISLAACDVSDKEDTGDTGSFGTSEQWEGQLLTDQGSLCLLTDTSTPNEDQIFSAATPITIQYSADICLSSSCDRNAEASVDINITDGKMDVIPMSLTTSASWEENVSPNASCTDDCGFLGAEYDLGTLGDGVYEVTYGDQSLTLTIPGKQSACFGELYLY